MSKLIPRITPEKLHPELADMLGPRIERLGYLGEFFQVTAHQPQSLKHFYRLTEELKEVLPNNITEVVALTVASLLENDYEKVQHERLSLKLGFSKDWVIGLTALDPTSNNTATEAELEVQKLVLATLRSNGHNNQEQLDRVIVSLGPEKAVAVLLLMGRYVMHALISNSLKLAPPVPSPITSRSENA